MGMHANLQVPRWKARRMIHDQTRNFECYHGLGMSKKSIKERRPSKPNAGMKQQETGKSVKGNRQEDRSRTPVS